VISLRLTGRLRRQFALLSAFFLSLWERTKVRVKLSWLAPPSPFPKGEGGIESTLLVRRVHSCSRSKRRPETTPVNVKLYESPSRAGGLPTIN
jgi:hypothetical protein